MRKRSGTCCPVHKYGIYSLLYKACPSGQLHSNENNTEMLMTRVKGISQKVDTMHLNEEDQTDSNQLDSLESYENGNKTITRTRVLMAAKDRAITPPTSASDNDNDVYETEEDSTTSNTNSTFIVSRRRKSPNVNAATAKTTATNLKTVTSPAGGGGVGGGGGGGGITPVLAEITLHRTPPMIGNGHTLMNNVNTTTATTNCSAAISTTTTNTSSSVTPLYSEKKLKKPSSNYEPAAALQRPTIASTVKMCQAAIEKSKSQTQGDKLNQIKAMRRQHNSRSGGSTG